MDTHQIDKESALLITISKRVATDIIQELHLPDLYIDEVRQRLFVRLLKVAASYRPGAISFASFCWGFALRQKSNERDYFLADKRRELLLREEEPERKDSEDAPAGYVQWVELLVSSPAKVELIADVRERCASLSADETALARELSLGLTTAESSLGWKECKRRRVLGSLREKFADLRTFFAAN